MKNVLAYIIAFFLANVAFAQYKFQWTKFFGNDSILEATSIGLTKSGSIIIAGTSNNYGIHTWIKKISADGSLQWTNFFSRYPTVVPNSLYVNDDSSFVIAGYNQVKENSHTYVWLAKFSPSGTLLWERAYYNFPDSYGIKVKGTKDKGYIIAANYAQPPTYQYDWLIIKTDSLGFVRWAKTTGTPYDDQVNDLAVLPNNTYAVAGYNRYDKGKTKVMSVSFFDSTGFETQFAKFRSFGWSEATAITATPDTGVVVTGFFQNGYNKNDIFVIKLDSLADSLWSTTLPIPFSEIPFSIIRTFDGNYVLAFTLWTAEFPYTDLGIAQITNNGKLRFLRLLRRNSDDFVAQLVEGKDNGIYMLATMYIYGEGWKVGLIKCESTEKSDLVFIKPQKNLITSAQPELTLKACVKGYKIPKQVIIYNNSQPVDTVKNFKITGQPQCPFYFETQVPLQLGYNNIILKVTDYKDFTFKRKRTVIYIPVPRRRW